MDSVIIIIIGKSPDFLMRVLSPEAGLITTLIPTF
ncbi:hypothetical protein B6N60_02365 [Richelia sinica FACHB-800]|uniref:Uncharacterized protein n=1 Tax=Richelia sinica FACHB-800 TaxID=1357546 RepID=A0A975T857_9NOST|nr:hypothetical protein B6N60_02365 [Richelia sinica FACHB-800]